ncbi:MAG: hypothetical protein U1D30_23365 [Planctomycetota bacterium]
MPELRISCPSCEKKLKIMNLRADATSVRCPFCDEVISIKKKSSSGSSSGDFRLSSSATRRAPTSQRAPLEEEDEEDEVLERPRRRKKIEKPAWRKVVTHLTPGNVIWTIVAVWFAIRFVFNSVETFRTWGMFFDARFGRDIRMAGLVAVIASLVYCIGFVIVGFNYRRDHEIRNIGWLCVIVGTLFYFGSIGANFLIAMRGVPHRMGEFEEFAMEYMRRTNVTIPGFPGNRPNAGALQRALIAGKAGDPSPAGQAYVLSNGQFIESEFDPATAPPHQRHFPKQKLVEFRVEFEKEPTSFSDRYRWIVSTPAGKTELMILPTGDFGGVQTKLAPTADGKALEGPIETWLETTDGTAQRVSNIVTMNQVDRMTPSERFLQLTEAAKERAAVLEEVEKQKSIARERSAAIHEEVRRKLQENANPEWDKPAAKMTIDDAINAIREGFRRTSRGIQGIHNS